MGTEKVEDDKCIHGLNSQWCAICLKQDEPEKPLIFKGILDKEVKK
jgi:hypothetical protein